MKKATLLLMGIINVIGIGLVSPVMTDFAADFPAISTTMVAMVVTMPAITLLLGLAVCAWLVTLVQRKHLLILGVCCVIIGGILPAFLSSFSLILFARRRFRLWHGNWNAAADYFFCRISRGGTRHIVRSE